MKISKYIDLELKNILISIGKFLIFIVLILESINFSKINNKKNIHLIILIFIYLFQSIFILSAKNTSYYKYNINNVLSVLSISGLILIIGFNLNKTNTAYYTLKNLKNEEEKEDTSNEIILSEIINILAYFIFIIYYILILIAYKKEKNKTYKIQLNIILFLYLIIIGILILKRVKQKNIINYKLSIFKNIFTILLCCVLIKYVYDKNLYVGNIYNYHTISFTTVSFDK